MPSSPTPSRKSTSLHHSKKTTFPCSTFRSKWLRSSSPALKRKRLPSSKEGSKSSSIMETNRNLNHLLPKRVSWLLLAKLTTPSSIRGWRLTALRSLFMDQKWRLTRQRRRCSQDSLASRRLTIATSSFPSRRSRSAKSSSSRTPKIPTPS